MIEHMMSRRGALAAGLSAGLVTSAGVNAAPAPSGRRIKRVLTIDGGGMRGVIPATFIDTLESMSGKPITDLFDLFVGASTGALLALGLNVPGPDGKQKYSARDIIQLYDDCGPIIFNKQKGFSSWFAGISKPAYDPAGLEGLLAKYFGDVTISESLRDVAVPAIHLEPMKMEVFSRRAAREWANANFPMRSIVRAATAAPTYFPAASIRSANGMSGGTYLDAATSTNNPGLIGLAESGVVHSDDRVVMVSLGTGRISRPIDAIRAKDWGEWGWVQAVFDLQSDAQSSYTEHVLRDVLVRPAQDTFFRFQIGLREMPIAMDETRKDHLDQLKDLTSHEIQRRMPDIRTLLELLTA